MLVHILGVLMRMPIWVSHKHAISTRKLCSLVISMLMSILQNVGTHTGRACENPYMGCLISTPRHTKIMQFDLEIFKTHDVESFGSGEF
jgi:hypothetical protein